MRPALPVGLVLAAVALACAGPEVAPARLARAPADEPLPPDGEAPPLLQLPGDVRPVRYALALEIDPSQDAFRGAATIEIALDRPRRAIWLHGRGLRVSAATVSPARGGSLPAGYRQVNEDGLARLDLAVPVGPGSATIRIAWEAGFGDVYGLFRARSGGDAYAATQLETHHARRVFPGFDEPCFKTPFDVSIVVPDGAVAISNGVDAGSEPIAGGGRRVRFATTKSLPTYLLFFGVGPFEVVTAPPIPPNEVRSAPIPVRGFAPRGRGAELELALRYTAEMLPWQERWFGIAYPYEKLDSIAVPGLGPVGMENAGAIAYADRIVLLAGARAGMQQQRAAAGLIAHELAHQWFGDLVTLPWWTDVWLNESFATWMTSLTLDAWRPEWQESLGRVRGIFVGGEPPAHRIAGGGVDWAMQGDALPTARAIRQPLVRISDVGAQFTAASYSKGAAVLGMFERWVGPAPFRAGVRAFVAAHAHGTGTTPELLEALSRAAGRDVAGPMETFLERPGVPLVEARLTCGPEGNAVRLAQEATTVRGVPPTPRAPWRIPVCIRYRVAGAEREGCTLLDSREGALPIPEGCPEWIFPNAGGAGYYRFALAAADLECLRRAGLARLEAAEKAALAGSVRAAQRARRLSYGEAMDVLADLGRDPHPAVAPLPMPAVAHAHRDLVPATARPAVEAFARILYRPGLDRLGWVPRSGEGLDDRRYRAELVRLLVRTARDPAVTREAARRGAAYLGVAGGAIETGAVDPDLAEDVVAAAIAEGGAPVIEVAIARALSTSDGAARERILTGIGFAGRPELVPRIFEVARDPRLSTVERTWPIEGAFKHPATRGAALDELERTAGELVRVLPPYPRRTLLAAMAWQCDARAADRVRAIFGPRFEAMPDLRLPVAEAVERIRACAAEREADGEAAARWFAARAMAAPRVGR